MKTDGMIDMMRLLAITTDTNEGVSMRKKKGGIK